MDKTINRLLVVIGAGMVLLGSSIVAYIAFGWIAVGLLAAAALILVGMMMVASGIDERAHEQFIQRDEDRSQLPDYPGE